MTTPARTSITVTVRNGDNFRATRPGKTYWGNRVTFYDIKEFFPETPRPPYRVTYSLSARGSLEVRDGACICAWVESRTENRDVHLDACFLTDLDWHGLRVTRTVQAIRKRGKG